MSLIWRHWLFLRLFLHYAPFCKAFNGSLLDVFTGVIAIRDGGCSSFGHELKIEGVLTVPLSIFIIFYYWLFGLLLMVTHIPPLSKGNPLMSGYIVFWSLQDDVPYKIKSLYSCLPFCRIVETTSCLCACNPFSHPRKYHYSCICKRDFKRYTYILFLTLRSQRSHVSLIWVARGYRPCITSWRHSEYTVHFTKETPPTLA